MSFVKALEQFWAQRDHGELEGLSACLQGEESMELLVYWLMPVCVSKIQFCQLEIEVHLHHCDHPEPHLRDEPGSGD